MEEVGEDRVKNVQSQPVVRRKVADVAAMQANATRRKSLAIVVCFACFPCVLREDGRSNEMSASVCFFGEKVRGELRTPGGYVP